ncbi:MAG: YciI family protein [Rhodoferax sp.]
MSYMLLIIEPTGQRQARTGLERRAAYDSMVEFAASLKARGVLKATESLASQAAGARVHISGGELRVLDGPFAEAKEMVGGFFLLDCNSFDEAVAIARDCPAAQWATIEVRAVGPCFT